MERKLELNKIALKEKNKWENIGIHMPQFDIEKMASATSKNPKWVHFGAGNIFRGYIARLQQELLNKSMVDEGIVVTETFDFDIIDKIYKPHDNITLLVTLNHNGKMVKEIIASLPYAYRIDTDYDKLAAVFAKPSLQMVSFTITEKGYVLMGIDGALLPVVAEDMAKGPKGTKHTMSIAAALLLERFNAGAEPIAMVSLDNCSHNGEKLKAAIVTIASAWIKNGYAPEEFGAYLQDTSKVSFPWSMIDKITPRPSEIVQKQLKDIGINGASPIVTDKNTFIAPFVNAEAAEYLVIEDSFPNARPPLDKVGVYFTDRQTVNMVETMKVTTCLNPLHTALAIFGCLLGYTSISDEMKDLDLVTLVKRIGYDEGMKVVINPGIICPKAFIDEVINQRLPNPFIPDTPQRIATDTSQKMGIRFGETIKSYIADPGLVPSDLIGIPLVIAGWMRYMLGVNDKLEPMELSSDPMLETLIAQLTGIEAAHPHSYTRQLKPILAEKTLFGVDLYEAGLGDKIEGYFVEMLGGVGSVRKTLSKYLSE